MNMNIEEEEKEKKEKTVSSTFNFFSRKKVKCSVFSKMSF